MEYGNQFIACIGIAFIVSSIIITAILMFCKLFRDPTARPFLFASGVMFVVGVILTCLFAGSLDCSKSDSMSFDQARRFDDTTKTADTSFTIDLMSGDTISYKISWWHSVEIYPNGWRRIKLDSSRVFKVTDAS